MARKKIKKVSSKKNSDEAVKKTVKPAGQVSANKKQAKAKKKASKPKQTLLTPEEVTNSNNEEQSIPPTKSSQDRVGAEQINLKESGRFWMIFIAVAIMAAIIIQSYGYLTGWGDPGKLTERYFHQAQRLTLAKRYSAAIKQYEKVINLEKAEEDSKRQALVGIADLYREQEEWKQAIAMYKQLQTMDDHAVMSAWSGLKIAESQLAAGQAEEALATYQQIGRRFPASDWEAEARLGQGKAYEALKKYDQAIALYQSLEEDYRGGFLAADALVQIGRCYERQGMKDKARATYESIIKTYPETMSDEAKRRLKRLKQGKHPLGIRHWEN